MTPRERDLLLGAVRPDPDAALAAAAGDVDWTTIERRARAHKLLALLAARVASGQLAAPRDEEMRRRLAAARADAERRGRAAERTLAALADAFAAAAVPFFVVKGSVLAHTIYEHPAQRRFADVDAVVRRADLAAAETALRGLGYRPGGIGSILAVPPPSGPARERAVALTRGFEGRQLAAHTWTAPSAELLSVDLHWHVSPWRLRVGEEAIWAHTTTCEIDRTRVRTLDPPATMLHLVAHATTSLLNGFRLLHLCDVAWAARRLAAHDAGTWRLAREWRVAPHLARVCRLVELALGVRLPLAAGAPPVRLPPGFSTVADPDFLLGATELAARPLAARLGAELAWATAMGCLRRNASVVGDVSLTRARFRSGRG